MRHWKIILVVALVLGAIGFRLVQNKNTVEERTRRAAPRDLPVTVAAVGEDELVRELQLTGSIDAAHEVVVASETQGRVLAVGAEVGDAVKKGDVLARVDAELRTAGLKSAQAAYDKAKLDYERARTLHEAASIPASQLEAARLGFESSEAQLVVAQRQAKDTTIRAPISGTVTSRPVEVGGMLDHGKQVATLVDVSALKVRVRVAERDAFRIKPGDPVSVTTEVYPGHEFHGKVRSIGVKADEARTFLVEVDLPNSPELPLRAGLFGRVAFASKGGRKGVVIPREALVGSIRKPQVYVVQDGVARLRDIVIDAEEGMTLGVASGLNAGESLVVHGQSNLKDGVKVEVSRQATALAEPTAQTPRQETAR